MIRVSLAIVAVSIFLLILWTFDSLVPDKRTFNAAPSTTSFRFQSVDTMKYSRDLAREKANDISFDVVIDRQTAAIAATGATHVAIATPYDDEFLPMLWRWVTSARRHGLKVWFRGNFSGWEKWFGYPRIGREEHLKKTKAFILANRDLFQDGDAFSSCPECENGGPGDPRQTGDVNGFRKFLIAEHDVAASGFAEIGKDVRADLFSMNGDVARLIMDKPTTKALGGTVTIDHYVKMPEQLVADVDDIARRSGGKVILGEFGVPIPDIHGNFTSAQQADWIEKTLALLEKSTIVDGMNYWISVGGSTEIWDKSGVPSRAVAVLREHFSPKYSYGYVTDELDRAVVGATVASGEDETITDGSGWFSLRLHSSAVLPVMISRDGFESQSILGSSGTREMNVVLLKRHKNLRFRLLEFMKPLVDRFRKR